MYQFLPFFSNECSIDWSALSFRLSTLAILYVVHGFKYLQCFAIGELNDLCWCSECFVKGNLEHQPISFFSPKIYLIHYPPQLFKSPAITVWTIKVWYLLFRTIFSLHFLYNKRPAKKLHLCELLNEFPPFNFPWKSRSAMTSSSVLLCLFSGTLS